jgi:hypothetical protein
MVTRTSREPCPIPSGGTRPGSPGLSNCRIRRRRIGNGKRCSAPPSASPDPSHAAPRAPSCWRWTRGTGIPGRPSSRSGRWTTRHGRSPCVATPVSIGRHPHPGSSSCFWGRNRSSAASNPAISIRSRPRPGIPSALVTCAAPWARPPGASGRRRLRIEQPVVLQPHRERQLRSGRRGQRLCDGRRLVQGPDAGATL